MAVVSQPLHAVEGFRHSLIPHLDTPGSGVLSCVGDEERFVSANVPVLIVGGGPIGLFQAYLLSRLGVQCLVIERFRKEVESPEAHALSPRSLEIARQFGLDVKHMRSLGTSREDAYWVNFCSSLGGEHLGRFRYERMDKEVLEVTPEMIHNMPQPIFEQLVTEALAGDSNVEFQKDLSFISCSQDGDSVITELEDENTGRVIRIRSHHLIACDGARSPVSTSLGVRSEGDDGVETTMAIHFKADLRPVVGEHVGMLHWILDPEARGVIVGYDLSDNNVLVCHIHPEKSPLSSWNEERCRKAVKAAIGRDDIPFEILNFRPWISKSKVAEYYIIGNVFLSGNTAHSFSSTGGLVLNSSLADAHNLSYKIAAVQQGWGTKKLLNSYQGDRHRAATINTMLSLNNSHTIFNLLDRLGVNDPDIAVARENLAKSLADPKQRESMRAGVREQQEDFDNLELHIGHVYGDKSHPADRSHYKPQYREGARLPHAWIKPLSVPLQKLLPQAVDTSYIQEFNKEDIAARQYSTLDLCAFNAFTIIVGSLAAWENRLEDISVLREARGVPLRIVALGEDFVMVPGQSGQTWLERSRLLEGGGIVVRPDQHILQVAQREASGTEIADCILGHLGFV